MKSTPVVDVDDVLELLRKLGVILETDRAFPSLTGMMVGDPIRGSWWSHPMANDIYMLSQRLIHHPDAVFLKLLSGKTSYVHRRLWPELIAIGTAQEKWQMDGLSVSAKSMLKKVEAHGNVRMDEIKSARTPAEKSADAKTLELRLLVFGDDVHTDSGKHVKRIETWEHWAWRTGFKASVLPLPDDAKAEFTRIVKHLNSEFSATATLPWEVVKSRGTRPRAKNQNTS
jgi:hypothetical protein